LGYADRLYYNENNLEERKAFVNIIRRNSSALLGLINDLLDVSKIESDQLEIEIEAFSLESLLNEVVSLMKQRAAEKGIELTVAISGKIPNQISTDRLRLRQILINLISNAIKFTKKGFVEIQVAYDNENSKVIFSVKDTGCGIKTERQQNLFLPFMQGDSSIRREYGGSGLGLYLSKKLATFLNSKLYLKNSVVDNGSVFSLEVPVGEIKMLEFTENLSSNPLDSEYDANIFPTKGLEKQAILIVEDVKENRDLFKFYLKRAGAEVVTAIDGEDGIEKIKSRHYDLVFMDLQMPKIDGYKAIEIIQQEKLFDGPVIALTAHAMRGEREKCIQAGFKDHLSKPVSAKNLVAFAKNFLKNRSTKEVEGSNTNYSTSEDFQKDTLEIEDSFKGNLPPPVKRAILHFVNHIPERVEAIEEACRSNDKVRVKSLIHRFKGSAGVCGFTQLFTELEKLEVEVDADFQRQNILKVLKRIRSSEKKLNHLYIA
jgi:CheY-like chemotaxis protein